MLYYCPFAHPANQDQKHFPLGTSSAKPAAGYFADVAGVANEQVIWDAIKGLSTPQEIKNVLFKFFQDSSQVHDFIKWRMDAGSNAPRPQRRKAPR